MAFSDVIRSDLLIPYTTIIDDVYCVIWGNVVKEGS